MGEALSTTPALKKSLHMSSTDVEKVFELFDSEGDGSLDVDELTGKLRIVISPARRLEQEILCRNTCLQEELSILSSQGIPSKLDGTGSATLRAQVQIDHRADMPAIDSSG